MKILQLSSISSINTMLYKLTEKSINHDSDLASAEYTAHQTDAENK